MKILYIYDKMPGIYQRYLILLLEGIKKKLTVHTLAYNKDSQADYQVVTYGFRDQLQRIAYRFGMTPFKSLDLKIMNDYDIIHLQHSFLFTKVIPLFKSNSKIKLVITLRGGDTYVKPLIDNRWNMFYENYSKYIKAFVTMSEHQKKYLIRRGVSAEKIFVIPISFGSHSEFMPKIPNKKILKLVSAFRLTWEKNIEGTFRFAKLLKDKNILFHYDIYGDGPELGQLYYFMERFELKEYVTVKGKIENSLLKEKLTEYDFFIQLSYSEALPTSVLEAQSVGLPCIVSNSGGLPEAVVSGKTAIVYDYWELDKMVADCVNLWKDENLYFQFSKQAIAHVNEYFTTEKEMEKLERMYRSL